MFKYMATEDICERLVSKRERSDISHHDLAVSPEGNRSLSASVDDAIDDNICGWVRVTPAAHVEDQPTSGYGMAEFAGKESRSPEKAGNRQHDTSVTGSAPGPADLAGGGMNPGLALPRWFGFSWRKALRMSTVLGSLVLGRPEVPPWVCS